MNLRVLTYNIQFGRGLDLRIDLRRIAECVRAFDADVIAFQEVDTGCARSGRIDQAAELADRLHMRHVYAPAIAYADGVSGLATMTRLPIVDSEFVALPGQPARWTHEPRIALMTRLRWHGRILRFINTHLSTSPFERPAQADHLVALPEVAADGDPTIVVGDLNCTARSPAMKLLIRHLTPAISAPSWPAIAPIRDLDHILHRGPLRVRSAGVWRGPGHRRVSDHLPLFAEFSL